MKYLFFDLETTGIGVGNNKVIELAAILYDSETDSSIDQYHTFIDPQMDITSFITNLTGITNQMVKNQPTEMLAFERFAAFIQKCNPDFICGHNIDAFDMKWVQHRNDLYNLGIDLTIPTLDTLKLAREISKEGLLTGYNFTTPKGAVSLKLEYLIKYFELGSQDHRAINDVINNINVYRKFMDLRKNNSSLGF